MIDLNDVTIIIPVRIDSLERTLNLNTQIKWLSQNVNLTIIVLEADISRSYYLPQENNKISYYFYKDSDSVFYRTHYLNILLKRVNTPIVGIWDTDVILSVEQMLDAVAQIREKKAVMSIPYDGRVYSVTSIISQKFRNDLDLECLTQHISESQLALGSMSVGGAIFVDKDQYLEAGGENEHFYGWGPEDFERVERMNKLHLPIYRSFGPLFHLYHPIGSNSTYANTVIEQKNQNEWFCIQKLNHSELKSYIETWKKPELLLQKIAESLMLKIYASDNIGLFYGKMGVAIFFFHYARYTGRSYYEDFAEDLLEFVSSGLSSDMQWGFGNGICGIGWGLEYLVQSGFLCGDTSSLLQEFDIKVMEKDPERVTDVSIEMGLTGLYYYVMARIQSAQINGKKYPFDDLYCQKLKKQMTLLHLNVSWSFQEIYRIFINKVPLGYDQSKWSLGLADGCAGYGLKLLLP